MSEHGRDWEGYYHAQEGRPPRPLFLEALPLLPTLDPVGRPLLAIDLGCGDGTEAIELLKRGWNVFAIDNHPDAIARLQAQAWPEHRARLTADTVSFRDSVLPRADLIYAGLSLPFCEPTSFNEVWRQIQGALRPNAWFVGHLFGARHGWAGKAGMTFVTAEQVASLLGNLRIHLLREQDEDGDSFSGPTHWHVFHVIAQSQQGAGRQHKAEDRVSAMPRTQGRTSDNADDLCWLTCGRVWTTRGCLYQGVTSYWRSEQGANSTRSHLVT